jgi:hypothetical protein
MAARSGRLSHRTPDRRFDDRPIDQSRQHAKKDRGSRRPRLVQTTLPYRREELSDISAELLAASASCAEICAVWAGVPQLGASLPSPQARGR